MYGIGRYGSAIDDKHAIRDPFGPNPNDMGVWMQTLLKTRIPELFLTKEGLPGHVVQIQCEINRISKVEGRSGEEVSRAVWNSEKIQDALIKSRDAARAQGFPCWDPSLYIHLPLLNDVVKL